MVVNLYTWQSCHIVLFFYKSISFMKYFLLGLIISFALCDECESDFEDGNAPLCSLLKCYLNNES